MRNNQEDWGCKMREHYALRWFQDEKIFNLFHGLYLTKFGPDNVPERLTHIAAIAKDNPGFFVPYSEPSNINFDAPLFEKEREHEQKRN
jgi:hypothetical protein